MLDTHPIIQPSNGINHSIEWMELPHEPQSDVGILAVRWRHDGEWMALYEVWRTPEDREAARRKLEKALPKSPAPEQS